MSIKQFQEKWEERASKSPEVGVMSGCTNESTPKVEILKDIQISNQKKV